MGNPLRAIFGRAIAAGAASIAKDAESFVKDAEDDAERIRRAIQKGREAIRSVGQELDEAIAESRKK